VWSLQFFDVLDAGRLQQISRLLEARQGKMSAGIEQTGRDTVAMSFLCDADLPEPERLGYASSVWRILDESAGRIWMIGATPRALFPEFMRQRREMLGRLTAERMNLWLWLALIRAEPLFASSVGLPSRAAEILAILRETGGGADVAEPFVTLANRLSDQTDARLPVARELGPEDLRPTLREALAAAMPASRDRSVHLMAYAAERTFDALLLLDRSAGAISPRGLAAAEDLAWYEDCQQLVNDGDDMDRVFRRTGDFARRLQLLMY
jgi:hypothetical protein